MLGGAERRSAVTELQVTLSQLDRLSGRLSVSKRDVHVLDQSGSAGGGVGDRLCWLLRLDFAWAAERSSTWG